VNSNLPSLDLRPIGSGEG